MFLIQAEIGKCANDETDILFYCKSHLKQDT